jgi:hypothetical protein
MRKTPYSPLVTIFHYQLLQTHPSLRPPIPPPTHPSAHPPIPPPTHPQPTFNPSVCPVTTVERMDVEPIPKKKTHPKPSPSARTQTRQTTLTLTLRPPIRLSARPPARPLARSSSRPLAGSDNSSAGTIIESLDRKTILLLTGPNFSANTVADSQQL